MKKFLIFLIHCSTEQKMEESIDDLGPSLEKKQNYEGDDILSVKPLDSQDKTIFD